MNRRSWTECVIARDGSRHGYRVADHAEEFLAWAVERFEARWLSSRCQNGDIEEVLRAFRLAGLRSNSPAWAVIAHIPAVKYGHCKALGIDFQSRFFWIDDAPDGPSLDLLRRHGRLDCLIRVDAGDPAALMQVRRVLEQAWSP